MVIHCKNKFNNDNLIYQKYFDKFSFSLSDFQKWSIYAIINGHHSLVTAHTGSGKCLKFNTEIIMFDGSIKKVQDIKIGDKLMGNDSTVRNVLGLAQGIEPMYKINLSDGDNFTCNESHILCLRYNISPFIKDNKNGNRYEVNWFDNNEIKMKNISINYKNNDKARCLNEAKKLVDEKILIQKHDFNISVKEFIKLPKYLQKNSLAYKVGIEFPEKYIEIDPYIIGLWLGDQSANNAEITYQDAVILKYLHEKIIEYDCYLQYRNEYTYEFTALTENINKGRENYIKTILNKYNLLNNKHIPDNYKINSRENRLKLLAGLIDSNGHYYCKTYEISEKDNILANDILYLAKSLGFACKLKNVKKSCYYDNLKKQSEYNRITIFGDNLIEIPVLCKRKKCNEKRLINKPSLEYHFKIQPQGNDLYYGFELDGNHKFILGNFVVTHNTLPAEFAIRYFKEKNKKVIYTGPIKALCNQKLYDFKQKFPNITFGILTGDIKDNPEADVLIMTTEILRNTLFNKKININNKESIPIELQFDLDIDSELGAVIFDEVHYIGDADRGSVWEQSILLLPPQVQLIMLSATIEKPEVFGEWLEYEKNKGLELSNKKELYMTTTYERVVPLTHYLWTTVQPSVVESIKGTSDEYKFREIINIPVKIANSKENFNDSNYYKTLRLHEYLFKNKIKVKRQYVLNNLIEYLNRNDMLPAICFIFSRKNVEIAAKEITIPLFCKDDKTPNIIENECEKILINKFKNYREYTMLEEYKDIISLLKKGIAIHHAGIMPVLREMVELLFEKRYIKLLFATETFAVGINMPTKSVIFTALNKFSGNKMRELLPHEYTQMAGRAGRRGIDENGYVFHCNNLFRMPEFNTYKSMLTGPPKMLISQFKISFNLILSIISAQGHSLTDKINNELITFMEKSFIQNDITKEINMYDKIQTTLEEKLKENEDYLNNKTICKTNYDILVLYHKQITNLNLLKNKQKKQAISKIEKIKLDNPTIEKDIKYYEAILETKNEIEKNNGFKINAINYIQTNIDNILTILNNNNYLEYNRGITNKGKVAMHIQEIHPLVIGDLYNKYNGFSEITSEELVSLFSCFTNISIANDLRLSIPANININTKIKEIAKYTNEIMEKYYNLETEYQLDTGSEYTLHFELIDYMIDWCKATNENECIKIINNIKSEKEIFLGEFIKSILKINNIMKELEKICEILENINLLEKIKKIPDLTLKYVVTNQSLYI